MYICMNTFYQHLYRYFAHKEGRWRIDLHVHVCIHIVSHTLQVSCAQGMRVVYGTRLGETMSLSLNAHPQIDAANAMNALGDPRVSSWYVRSSMPRYVCVMSVCVRVCVYLHVCVCVGIYAYIYIYIYIYI
jgi:hypothetical protein